MHLKSPTAALADALSDTEDGAGRAAVPPPQMEAKRERRFLFRMFCVILSCIATFGVARLTLQTRKAWCRDRPKRWRHAPASLPSRKEEKRNKTPRDVGPLGNPSEEPDSCFDRRTESHRAKMWASPHISNARIVKLRVSTRRERSRTRVPADALTLGSLPPLLPQGSSTHHPRRSICG